MDTTDRELRIRASVEAEQAKSEIRALNAELEKVPLTEYAAQAASEKQAIATFELGKALGEAQTAMGAFAIASVDGGKAAETALLAARDATAALEVAIAKAKALGAPVSPTTISTLANYDAAVAAATAETEALSAAQAGAGNANRLVQAEARVSMGVLGQYGRALGILAGDHDNLAGAISRMVLPIAAVAVVGVALNKVFKDLEAHGVDVKSAGTLISEAMDAIRVSLGGVSEAAKVNQDAFEKVRTGMRDVAPAAQVYKTALDLAAAASLDYAAGLAKAEAAQRSISDTSKEEASALAGVATGFELVETSIDNVAHAWDRALVTINTLRSTMPATAEVYTKALEQMIAEGVNPADARFVALTDAIGQTKKEMEAHTAQLKDAYGPAWKEVETALGKFSATAQNVKDQVAKMTAAELDDDAIIKALRPELEQLADAEARYGGQIAKNDPQLQRLILSLKKYWEGQDTASKATDAAVKAMEKAQETAAGLADSYDKLQKKVVESIEKMRAKRDEDVASIQKQTAKTETEIHKQEDDLQAQWIAGKIGATDYRREMDALLKKGVDEAANAAAETIKLNKAEQKSEEEKVQEFGDASSKIMQKLDDLGYSYEEAEGFLAGFREEQEKTVDQQKVQLEIILATHAPLTTLGGIMKENAAQQREMHAGLVASNKQIGAQAKAAAAATKALAHHARAARAIRVK